MAESSTNNGWVESYLEALLSEGLSSEYIKKPSEAADEKAAKFHADRQIYSKYYVNQILQQNEEGLRDAWSKATSAKHYEEKDARLEYLSWRVWFMKQQRARVMRTDAKTLAEEKVDLPDEDLSDDEMETPKAGIGAAVAAKTAQPAQTGAAKPPKPSPLGKPAEAEKDAADLAKKDLKVATQVSASRSNLSLADDTVSSPLDHTPVSADVFDNRVDGLYIILISLHGLIRGERMELGKDADTGGQVKYVVELARALAQHPAVYRVDLLTRQIKDSKVDKTYGEPEECLLRAEGADNDLGGAYVVRLPCGNVNQYLRKEKLWPHVREFADRGIAYAKSMQIKLAEAKTPCELYVIHGHYADAGEVAALMSSTLNVDMCMTGHSLGRNKLEHLLASGTMSKLEIEQTYKISRRVEAEERALESAIMVFTSTQQEIDEQWGLYDSFDSKLENVLRYRRRIGRHMPCMNVIPPGLDFSSLKVDLPEDPAIKEMLEHKPVYGSTTPRAADTSKAGTPKAGTPKGPEGVTIEDITDKDKETESKGHPKPIKTLSHRASFSAKGTPKAEGMGVGLGVYVNRDFEDEPPIWKEIARFLRNPRKPVILAMSRPDAKKNITTLVKAFGENSTLRELANLVLIMGNRDNIDSMAGGSQKVLMQVMKLIDSHDLYGSVAYPKKHQQKDISDIYRLPLATRGIFTNVALQEPFGLTVIEAAAHGVPTVATKNGGPVDIMSTLHHGLLVDPNSSTEIADALLKILTNPIMWDEMSHNGVANIMAYSWPSHCKTYLESLEGEKRFVKSHKKHPSRMSGSWDHNKVMGNSQGMDRGYSTPYPEKTVITHRMSRDREAFWKDNASDDGRSNTRGNGTSFRGADRKGFIAVPLDGEFRVDEIAHLLQDLFKVVTDEKGPLGVGLVSAMGFDDTKTKLEGAGVPMERVDWVVCHSGADIWHAKGYGKETSFSSDENYEEILDFRWDRVSMQRLLTKLVTAPTLLTPAPSTQLKGLSPLVKALQNMPDPEKTQKGVHPHHVCVTLDSDAKRILGKGKGGGLAVSTAIVDRLRRRLRSNGYRAHLTLQLVPEGKGELLSSVHITPLRGSRALSLRYLADTFGLDMHAMTVLVLPPTIAQRGETYLVGSYTSDLAELVSGVCKVFIEVPKQLNALDINELDAGDAQSIDRLTVKVSPKLFGDRVQFMSEGDDLTKVVNAANEALKLKDDVRA